jgi:hypothetical protein
MIPHDAPPKPLPKGGPTPSPPARGSEHVKPQSWATRAHPTDSRKTRPLSNAARSDR